MRILKTKTEIETRDNALIFETVKSIFSLCPIIITLYRERPSVPRGGVLNSQRFKIVPCVKTEFVEFLFTRTAPTIVI